MSVEITGSAKGTIRITHKKHHAPKFLFCWNHGHFIGYFIDGDGKESQAVVSLYTARDAIHFVSAYAILNGIWANQKGT